MYQLKTKGMNEVYSLIGVKIVRNYIQKIRMSANATILLISVQVESQAKTADTNALTCH